MIDASNIKNLWEHIHTAIKENPVSCDKTEKSLTEVMPQGMEAWEIALSKAVDADLSLPLYDELDDTLVELLIEYIDNQIEMDKAHLFTKDEDADSL